MKTTLKILSLLLIIMFILTSCSSSPKKSTDTRGVPAGGFVFYDKGFYSDGWRYLEAAPASSEFNADWGAWSGDPITWTNMQSYDVPGTSTGIGTGKRNTELIIAKLNELGQTARAAQLCVALNINGFSGWFLPSRDELNLMYENLHLQGQGDFGQGTNPDWWMNWWYWSSSQYDTNDAWFQNFSYGNQGSLNKNNANRFRAVRAF
jgi:hypothetical protein